MHLVDFVEMAKDADAKIERSMLFIIFFAYPNRFKYISIHKDSLVSFSLLRILSKIS